jgi:predicted NBD/HSP70 family sugar kinase
MPGGSNLPRVSDYNRVLVVDLVRRNPGISRGELAERTGLTTQTVSNICTHLAAQGLVEEQGRTAVDGGRVRTVYRVVPSGRHAIGLHIDPARTVLALVDLAGQVIDRADVGVQDLDPDRFLDTVTAAVRDLVAGNGVPGATVSGLGVAAPGPIDQSTGSVVGAPMLPGWDLVRIRDGLAARLQLPVELEKDTVAAATGELWAGSAPSDDFLFVYLGAGTGGGVVLRGEVAHGASGNLGNFGHLLGDPDGPVCECGARGCIAATATPFRLVEQAAAAGLFPMPAPDPVPVEEALARLAAAAAAGEPRARDIVERAARGFGRAAANLVNVLDLDAVVLGGPNWPFFRDAFLRVVPEVVEELHLFRHVHGVQVVSSALGDDVGPIGAASLVFAKAVSARPSLLTARVG